MCACDPTDHSYYSVILNLNRGPRSLVTTILAFARMRGHQVRRLRAAGRERWRYDNDTGFGYACIQQNRGYLPSAHDSRQVGWRFVNQALRSLTPLGSEWVGRTAQGHPVRVYRSQQGVDYDIRWGETCTQHGSALRFTEASPLLRVHAGAFSDGGSYQDLTDGATISLTFTGALYGAHATGTFGADIDGCPVGPFLWTAAQIG